MLVKERYFALDVFRGVTVAMMILVNNPGSWKHIYAPLEHSKWHGLTPADLVFPFFLFVVGTAIAFVMPKLKAGGDVFFWKKTFKRSLLIFLIGLFLNWSPFFRWEDNHLVFKTWTWTNADGTLEGIRTLGILQRIAVNYCLASIIIYYTKPKGTFITGIILLVLYWLLCVVLGSPSDPYSITGWFGTPIDKAIIGDIHMLHGEVVNGKPYAFELQSLVTMIPSTVQIIFDFLVGDYIIRKKTSFQNGIDNASDKSLPLYFILTNLFFATIILLIAGYVWGLSFPVNKKLWSSTYVLVTTGMAIAILAAFIFIIELKNKKGKWTHFFDMFGKNLLFIFVLSMFLPALLELIRIPNGISQNGTPDYLSPLGWFYEKICAKIPGAPENGSLLFALCMVLFYWVIAYWMNKKRIYIKV